MTSPLHRRLEALEKKRKDSKRNAYEDLIHRISRGEGPIIARSRIGRGDEIPQPRVAPESPVAEPKEDGGGA